MDSGTALQYHDVNNNCKSEAYMRKYYLDNVRWITVVTVVIYHVFYMYNAEGLQGVVGKITDLDVQYYDVFQYIVYPWIMIVLFMVSGICSRLNLDDHSHSEFIRSRTTKLLVPSTVGLFVFHFIQGYLNMRLSGALENEAWLAELPLIFRYLLAVVSGTGVLWYIQLLWLFSLLLVLVRKIDKDRLYEKCKGLSIAVIIAMVIPTYLAAQVLNTPKVVVYRFGLYFFVFLFGYFVLSHDDVIEVIKKYFPLMLVVSLAFGTSFCVCCFGENYAIAPAYISPLFIGYGYFASLALIGGMAKYMDRQTPFTKWMRDRSFGLYVFHYLGISVVAVYIAKPGYLPALAVYLLSAIAGFGLAYLLNAVMTRLPFFKWAVLGIKEKKNV